LVAGFVLGNVHKLCLIQVMEFCAAPDVL
jgi:hypothetical protein